MGGGTSGDAKGQRSTSERADERFNDTNLTVHRSAFSVRNHVGRSVHGQPEGPERRPSQGVVDADRELRNEEASVPADTGRPFAGSPRGAKLREASPCCWTRSGDTR